MIRVTDTEPRSRANISYLKHNGYSIVNKEVTRPRFNNRRPYKTRPHKIQYKYEANFEKNSPKSTSSLLRTVVGTQNKISPGFMMSARGLVEERLGNEN